MIELPDDPLEAIELIREIRAVLDVQEARAVRDAREAGATWQDVGEALGIARQNAWRKYRLSTNQGGSPCGFGR